MVVEEVGMWNLKEVFKGFRVFLRRWYTNIKEFNLGKLKKRGGFRRRKSKGYNNLKSVKKYKMFFLLGFKIGNRE